MYDHAGCAKAWLSHRDIVHARLFQEPTENSRRVSYANQEIILPSLVRFNSSNRFNSGYITLLSHNAKCGAISPDYVMYMWKIRDTGSSSMNGDIY